MRVISGSIKGRRLLGPEPGDISIRPTSDRAKEAIFSILQKYTSGSFLDLFAGTGAMAIEAWSRGYNPVTCVEKQASAIRCISHNTRGTGIKIISKDIRNLPMDYFANQTIIFADPPYESSSELWLALCPLIKNWLAPNYGTLIWETNKATSLKEYDGINLIETRRYGNSMFHIFNS